MLTSMSARLTIVALACLFSASALALAGEPRQVNVPAGSLIEGLESLAKQCGVDVIYPSSELKGLKTHGVSGMLEPKEAFRTLIEGTPLILKDQGSALLISLPSATTRSPSSNPSDTPGADNQPQERKSKSSGNFLLAQATPGQNQGNVSVDRSDQETTEEKTVEKEKGLPEILVRGSKILNMDIERSRDDPQPYVIFDQDTIARSAAVNVEDFFKQRLTMNTAGATNGQADSFFGNASTINLRGLGTDQTLILIDGHRSASFYSQGSLGQSDVNGIPLAAIERIEVLPATASGIYGGGATGGVINIILKRDYSGTDLKVTYDNTFATNSANRRVDFSSGFNLEGGKTNILLTASFSDADLLLQNDRDFLARGRADILANNSNMYGAVNFFGFFPPLGATPNIISATGANLVLKNGTPLNSPITYVPVGYPGSASDGGAALVANAGKYNLALANSAYLTGGDDGLSNGPINKSLNITLRRQFSDNVQGFLEASASDVYARFEESLAAPFFSVNTTAPNNPFNQTVLVTVPGVGPSDTLLQNWNDGSRLIGGIIIQLPRSWMMEGDYTWSRYTQQFSSGAILDPALGGNTAVASGTLNVLRDVNAYPLNWSPYLEASMYATPFDSTLEDGTVRVSGPLVSLPAGALTLSTLVERRDELFGAGTFYSNSTQSYLYPSRSQSINSLYLEAQAPLISSRQNVWGISDLELQVAGRWDDYTVNGATGFLANPTPNAPIARSTSQVSSTNPTVAISYKPVQDLMLRASYGTGFVPPDVNQVQPSPPVQGPVPNLLDPLRGNTPVGSIETIFGGNTNLKPEKSQSRSVGFVFIPHTLSSARLSIDYTRITKTNDITALSYQQILDNESFLPGRVVRGPKLPTDPPSWAGPITLIDDTNVNIATAEVDAYDMQLDYHKETDRFGTFGFFALATWEPHYKTQLAPSLPVVENVGIEVSDSIPVKIKANAGLTWDYRHCTLGWNARYFDSYLVADPTIPQSAPLLLSQGNGGRVPSQIYHDVFITYRIGKASGPSLGAKLVANTEIQLGVRNVFNKEPPFDASFSGGYYSPLGDPRLSSYYLSLRHSF